MTEQEHEAVQGIGPVDGRTIMLWKVIPIVVSVLSAILIPFAVWSANEIFHLKEKTSLNEQRIEDLEERMEDHMESIRQITARIDGIERSMPKECAEKWVEDYLRETRGIQSAHVLELARLQKDFAHIGKAMEAHVAGHAESHRSDK